MLIGSAIKFAIISLSTFIMLEQKLILHVSYGTHLKGSNMQILETFK